MSGEVACEQSLLARDAGLLKGARVARMSEYSRSMADGDPSDPIMRSADRHREERRPVEEAGGGQSEGFELAERDLIEHASHGDQHSTARIMRDAGRVELERPNGAVYGDADSEHIRD